MKVIIRVIGLASIILHLLFTQVQAERSPDNIWDDVQAAKSASLSSDGETKRIVKFNSDVFSTFAGSVAKEKSDEVLTPGQEIFLPGPGTDYERFKIIESPVMVPGLAKRYPEIKTYRGVGIDNPSASLRLDVTPAGCHAQVHLGSEIYYIDPMEGRDFHMVRRRSDMKVEGRGLECSFIPLNVEYRSQGNTAKARQTKYGATLRVFRLAIAATGEYTAFHGGTKAAGLAAIATAVNRINQIYENDFTTRLILVANNDQIIYDDATTDPYDQNNISSLLSVNVANVNSVIGVNNYDIGHLFCTISGGFAGFAVACSNNKAGGVTGEPSPVGDGFWVDYVAHELAHQFGAEHSFNGEEGLCYYYRSELSAYEPGSGTTIMSYAGLCSRDNLQNHSDPHFHVNTLEQVNDFLSYVHCSEKSNSGNTPPAVNAGLDYAIPIQTPFSLTASASDIDGDYLTYSWEQWDLGDSQKLTEQAAIDNGSSPRFRCWAPTNSPTRTFPKLSYLLENTTPPGENLPTVSRSMKFRVVVRDNNSGAGGVSIDDLTLVVSEDAGPFVVTSPNSEETWNSPEQTITWDVANTTEEPVNCTKVNILLSLDGGYTWPYTLAAATTNDGIENITLPVVNSTNARIKVEGFNNIFFDISNEDISILLGDSNKGSLHFSENNSNYDENSGTVNIEVIRSSGSTGNVSIDYMTLDDSAKYGLNYEGQTGTLSFAGGQTSDTINITIYDDDIYQGDLKFDLMLMNPEGGVALGNPVYHKINIIEDEEPVFGTVTICNDTPITINQFGAASTYPTEIEISNITGLLDNVTVELKGFGHTYVSDVDIILEGPKGKSTIIMSDVGAGANVQNIDLSFTETADYKLPSTEDPTTGFWYPSDYGDVLDELTEPAPSEANAELAVFKDISPNGVWKLYVYDDYLGDSGQISGGWCLHFKIPVTVTIKEMLPILDNIDITFDTTLPGSFGLLKCTNLVGDKWVTNQTFDVSSAGIITKTDTNALQGNTAVFYSIGQGSNTE